MTTDKKQKSSPFNILFLLILIVYFISFLIPSGEYQRVVDEVTKKTIVDPTTFSLIPKVFVNPIKVLFQIPKHALKSFGALLITMLVVGGTIKVVQDTDTLDLAINNLVKKFGRKSLLIIPILLVFTGFLGTASVMISTVIAFIPLGLTIAKRLKVDNIFAVALMFLGSYTGFMSSPISPVTTAIAQEIAGIPVYSGFEFRTALTVILIGVTILYLMFYAYRVSKDPSKSVMQNISLEQTEEDLILDSKKFTLSHGLILFLFIAGFVFFAYGSYNKGYGVSELPAIMLPVAIVSGLLGRMSSSRLADSFVKGAQGMVMPILFMILSGAVAIILDQGKIMDSIVYYLSVPLSKYGKYVAVEGMFIFNSIVNLAIPSGSGQAVVVMPIMGPLSDVLGVTRQTAVLAYQLGDGFTNLLNPTSSLLLGSLAIAGASLKDWFKLILPLYLILFVIISMALMIAVRIGWS